MNKLHTEQARNPERTEAPPGRRAPRTYWVYRTAWDDILGPILFTAVVLAQEALRSNEYNPVAEPVSALEAGPNGWVQQVNFVIFGVLTIRFAVGLHRGPRQTRMGIVGPALLVVSGVGRCSPGSSRCARMRQASPTTPEGTSSAASRSSSVVRSA